MSVQIQSSITLGIRVSVVTAYQPSRSNPDSHIYTFSYKIRIENLGRNTIQLLFRHWDILDGAYGWNQVEGAGVVGRQPVLAPGTSYEYVSGCSLRGGMGKMQGFYTMKRMVDGELFTVEIPGFLLMAPDRMN